jgi:hypothetical protein
MKTLRTPDEHFADLAEFPYIPMYCEIDDGDGGRPRVAAEHPERFARIVVVNTGLPTGNLPMPEIWWRFREAIQGQPRSFLQEAEKNSPRQSFDSCGKRVSRKP